MATTNPANDNAVKPVRPTSLNLSVLRRLFASSESLPNRIASTSAPHIKRCFQAGLVEVSADGKTLTLTAAGLVARSA